MKKCPNIVPCCSVYLESSFRLSVEHSLILHDPSSVCRRVIEHNSTYFDGGVYVSAGVVTGVRTVAVMSPMGGNVTVEGAVGNGTVGSPGGDARTGGPAGGADAITRGVRAKAGEIDVAAGGAAMAGTYAGTGI